MEMNYLIDFPIWDFFEEFLFFHERLELVFSYEPVSVGIEFNEFQFKLRQLLKALHGLLVYYDL